MRLVIVVLVLLTLYLQYALWYTRGGIHDVEKLKVSVAEQNNEIERLKERNRSLSAEVIDLKQGLEAVEERARSEMGMIKNGEVFFRITDPNHTHNGGHTGIGGASSQVEPPLEPPLDPLAPGDGGTAGSPPAPELVDDQAEAAKPSIKSPGKPISKSAVKAKAPLVSPTKPSMKANSVATSKPPTKAPATPPRKSAAFE